MISVLESVWIDPILTAIAAGASRVAQCGHATFGTASGARHDDPDHRASRSFSASTCCRRLPPARAALVGRWGEQRYKGHFSLASALGLVLIVAGYAHSGDRVPVFAPLPAAKAIAPLAMTLSFILLAAAKPMRDHRAGPAGRRRRPGRADDRGSSWACVLGQSIVVENQSGGGGVVGSMATTRAAPDGYTLMVGYVGTHGTNPAVRKLPYDAIKDFTPIAMVGGTPNILIVPPALPVNTLQEFVQYAKKNPGKLSYGSSGPGDAHAPRDGTVEDRRRHGSRACPLSRHRPGVHRHPRRPDAGDVPGARRGAAAHQVGHA